jgi:hypothetical protein
MKTLKLTEIVKKDKNKPRQLAFDSRVFYIKHAKKWKKT